MKEISGLQAKARRGRKDEDAIGRTTIYEDFDPNKTLEGLSSLLTTKGREC